MRASSLQVESKVPKRSKDFIDRVNTDGGSPLSYRQVKDNLYPLDRKGILEKASLVLTPSGLKENVLYVNEPNDGTADFDFTQNTTNGTIINKQGNIETVPANTPRIDWKNGTPDILVEESRTNLVTQSSDFAHSDWAKLGTGTGLAPAITLNAEPSIFEGELADSIVFDRGSGNTGSDQSRMRIDIPHIEGNDYTGSLWIKAATAADVGKEIAMRPFGSVFAVFTLTDEWQRVHRTIEATVDNNIMEIINKGGVTADNQVGVIMTGAQNEKASTESSDIPTTGAIATRNDDFIRKSGMSSLIGQGEGFMYVEAEWTGSNSRLFNISESISGSDDYIEINAGSLADSARIFWQANGVFNSRQISGSLSIGQHKVCVVYSSSSIKLFVDGILEIQENGTGWTNNIPLNLDRVWIGSSPASSTSKWRGGISKAVLGKASISDQEAINLTTL